MSKRLASGGILPTALVILLGLVGSSRWQARQLLPLTDFARRCVQHSRIFFAEVFAG